MSDKAEPVSLDLEDPGVESAVAFPGLSINGFTNSANEGIVFATLKPFEERHADDMSGNAIAARLQASFNSVEEAFISIFPPPPVQGLGTIGGFKLQIQDRSDQGFDALNAAVGRVLARAYQTPELAGVFSNFQINAPQLYADLDRDRAKREI